MTSTTGSFSAVGRQGKAASGVWTVLRRIAGWPLRVYEARQLMHQLSGLEEHELRDIGLTRGDLRDASALALDADPSLALHRRAQERRRRR